MTSEKDCEIHFLRPGENTVAETGSHSDSFVFNWAPPTSSQFDIVLASFVVVDAKQRKDRGKNASYV